METADRDGDCSRDPVLVRRGVSPVISCEKSRRLQMPRAVRLISVDHGKAAVWLRKRSDETPGGQSWRASLFTLRSPFTVEKLPGDRSALRPCSAFSPHEQDFTARIRDCDGMFSFHAGSGRNGT